MIAINSLLWSKPRRRYSHIGGSAVAARLQERKGLYRKVNARTRSEQRTASISLDTIVHAGRHSASAIEEIMNFRQIDQSPRTFVLVFQTGAERAKAFKIRRRTGVIGREFQGCRRSEICGSRLV